MTKVLRPLVREPPPTGRPSCGSASRATCWCCRPGCSTRSGSRCWPTTSSTTAGRAAEKAPAQRAVAGPPDRAGPGPRGVRRLVTDTRHLRPRSGRLVAGRSPRRRAGPAGRPGPAPPAVRARPAVQCRVRPAQPPATPTWRAARLDRRRRRAAGRAGAPARTGARRRRTPSLAVPGPRRRRLRGGHDGRPAGRPCARSTRSHRPPGTFAHILVDEAQDITPMQWRMLRRRGPSASWTIVGDPAQSSWPDADEADRALNEIVGTSPVRHLPDEHQLPQPGRGLRPGRQGGGRGRTPRPTCRRRCARSGSSRGWPSPARAGWPRRPDDRGRSCWLRSRARSG